MHASLTVILTPEHMNEIATRQTPLFGPSRSIFFFFLANVFMDWKPGGTRIDLVSLALSLSHTGFRASQMGSSGSSRTAEAFRADRPAMVHAHALAVPEGAREGVFFRIIMTTGRYRRCEKDTISYVFCSQHQPPISLSSSGGVSVHKILGAPTKTPLLWHCARLSLDQKILPFKMRRTPILWPPASHATHWRRREA